MRHFFAQLHKWWGLIFGIIIAIVAVTGVLYTFSDEIRSVTRKRELYIAPATNDMDTTILPMNRLLQSARRHIASREQIFRIEIFPAKNRTWVFRSRQINKRAYCFWNYYESYHWVFINPYTGTVQAVRNMKGDFFEICLQLHRNLLLGEDIGQPIINFSVMALVIIVITGFIIRLPKKLKGFSLRKLFSFRKTKNKKTLLWQSHAVIGMYALPMIVIISLTGLMFSFKELKKWTEMSVNTITGTSASSILKDSFSVNCTRNVDTVSQALDYIFEKEKQIDQISYRIGADVSHFDLQLRRLPNKVGVYVAYNFTVQNGTFYIGQKSSDREGVGSRLVSSNYDIHTGNIGGIPTKMINFLVALALLSFPITGYLMYKNKK